MNLAQAVASSNHAANEINRIGNEFYNILLPWQGKKVVKVDGTPTKEFSKVFSGLTQFNRQDGFLHVSSYCSRRGINLSVTSHLDDGYANRVYHAGLVDDGILKAVNLFHQYAIYDLAEMSIRQEKVREAERAYQQAKDRMEIFYHHC